MQIGPTLAFATTSPPRSSRALSVLQHATPSSAEIDAALSGLPAEIAAAEAVVAALEVERRALLLSGAEAAIDALDHRIATANRLCERLEIAKAELPKRLDARRVTETGIDQRVAKAKEAQQRGLAVLVELHPYAARVAELLGMLWAAYAEIDGLNEDAIRLGVSARVEGPLQVLAQNLGCTVDELPAIGDWMLPGYFPEPPRADRAFDRARDLVKKGRTK